MYGISFRINKVSIKSNVLGSSKIGTVLFSDSGCTILNSPECKQRYFEETERNNILPITLPAEADFLVKQECPVERPGRAALKPALAAENRRQAGRSRHIAGGAALAQVGQEES